VRIRGDRLKQMADDAGVSVEELAAAVSRTGLDGERALKAVRNWLNGRDHPRCKASDIAKLAAAVGARPKDIARFVSQVAHHRGSPRKARLVADMIRGKSYQAAENMLRFSTKRASLNVLKALTAAYADAEQAQADAELLVVAESRVDAGPTIKRFQPKDRGRAHQILKRTSHVTIGLEEKA
jgi:large subunit ribosomal protein L22